MTVTTIMMIRNSICHSPVLRTLYHQSLFRSPTRIAPASLEGLMNDTDVFIFDCDGVIWKGQQRIGNAHNVIRELRRRGKHVYFVTNNSTKSRLNLKKKFEHLDIEVDYEEILSSAFAAALYLNQKGFGHESSKKVYVLGESGICDELSLGGIECIGGPAHNGEIIDLTLNKSMKVDEEVGAVVAGLDTQINYYKIQYAQLCLNELNCDFLATNCDELAHLTSSQKWAGGGAIIGALKGCTGRDPVIVGKPSSFLIDYIISRHNNLDNRRVCMVGDRLNTDVLFGLNNHLTTLLTLSGVTDEEHLFSDENETIPHYYMNNIDDLLL